MGDKNRPSKRRPARLGNLLTMMRIAYGVVSPLLANALSARSFTSSGTFSCISAIYITSYYDNDILSHKTQCRIALRVALLQPHKPPYQYPNIMRPSTGCDEKDSCQTDKIWQDIASQAQDRTEKHEQPDSPIKIYPLPRSTPDGLSGAMRSKIGRRAITHGAISDPVPKSQPIYPLRTYFVAPQPGQR